jgi:hypothetical protein
MRALSARPTFVFRARIINTWREFLMLELAFTGETSRSPAIT